MNDTVDKLVVFLAKRDGIDKLVKTFQYVSKLVHWRVEATHPDIAQRFKQWEVASGLSRKAFRTGREGIRAERKLLVSSKEDSKGAKDNIRKIRADRVMRFMSIAANTADLIIALADIEPNPFCNHAVTLGISGLVSAWAGWYRNWPS
ncbi:hypothetical protein GH714_040343 [Hevea brasiliensis]|uniref:Peroxisomal membrane protein 11B n=1 Tax=Hevea brasiliensis TaxID=3981 RepID=A0A6A6MRF5_HEVBR|nr:hypothetical protein GH714_040343 [Hevea brasiliensis]